MGLAIDKPRDHVGGDDRMMAGQNWYDLAAHQLLSNRLISPIRKEGFVGAPQSSIIMRTLSRIIHVRHNQILEAP